VLAALVGLLALGGCASTHTQPPPYGIVTYEHTHHETIDPATDKVTSRDCHTHVEGGVETAGAILNGQSCGDTIGGSTTGITAFPGQAIGAPIYLAKVQADAARDQALIAGGYQLGGQAACLGMLGVAGASAGIALPAAAAACLQALKGITPTKPVPAQPVPVPPVVVVPPPPPPPPAMLESPEP
jgi:hypothetical protein